MSLVFSFPEYDYLAKQIAASLSLELGDFTFKHFPDGESYIKFNSSIEGKDILLVCGLNKPDPKALPLIFFSRSAKNLGAKSITLITPYLSYMRQDKRFQEGEVITSRIFAEFLSNYIDALITIDPHLHRYKSLKEIYSVPEKTLHASNLIAEWIKQNIEKPVLLGPDKESSQWVQDVATKANAAFSILNKIRHGDKSVEISFPEASKYKDHTPVIVDDIISSGTTMIETVRHLNDLEISAPICIGIHPIFAEDAYEKLQAVGPLKIISCNTIPHPTNAIDVSPLLVQAIKDLH